MGKTHLSTSNIPAIFAPTTKAPLDNRLVVDTYADLTNTSTFNGNLYKGIVVSVVKDTSANNGLYILDSDPSTTSAQNWVWTKLMTSSDIPEVPVTSVNNKTGAVTLSASDVGALPDTTSIPSKTSDLTNDSGFITSSDIPDPYDDTNVVKKVNVGDTEYTPDNNTVSLPAYPTSLPASDVQDWAKAETKPIYDYSEILNTPEIPSAPGTLNTNNTTAQSVSASESLSGTINLHKISKTGKYTDLIDKPTIPTVNDTKLNLQFGENSYSIFTANSNSDRTIQLQSDENIKITTIGKEDNLEGIKFEYSLPIADKNTLGGIKLGYLVDGKNYPVELNNNKAFVNVPWTDTNTTYKLTLNGTQNGSGTTNLGDFYAPTSAGTSGQYLKSNGTDAPIWANFPSIPDYSAGDNISISNNEINAVGYTYDTDKNSFAEGQETYIKSGAIATEALGYKIKVSNVVAFVPGMLVQYNGNNGIIQAVEGSSIAISNPTSTGGYFAYDPNVTDLNIYILVNNVASGDYSHAGGIGTIANQEAMTAIGKYNEELNDGGLFAIGNGTSNNRQNIIEVYNDKLNINNNIYFPIEKLVHFKCYRLSNPSFPFRPGDAKYMRLDLSSSTSLNITFPTSIDYTCESICVLYNKSASDITVTLPSGNYIHNMMGVSQITIGANKIAELVFTLWSSDLISFNGGVEV